MIKYYAVVLLSFFSITQANLFASAESSSSSSSFVKGDRVLVTDPNSKHKNKTGIVLKGSHGYIRVDLDDAPRIRGRSLRGNEGTAIRASSLSPISSFTNLSAPVAPIPELTLTPSLAASAPAIVATSVLANRPAASLDVTHPSPDLFISNEEQERASNAARALLSMRHGSFAPKK